MNKDKQNYFKTDEGKQAALYKLWVAWLPQHIPKWGGKKTRVWFGFNKRKNNGLDWLIEHAKSLRAEFKVAKIYDNKTGNELYSIPGLSETNLNLDEHEN